MCVEFVRSEFSLSDFDETQAQHEEMCDYAKRLYAALPSKPLGVLVVSKLPARPLVTVQNLLRYYKDFDVAWSEYAQAEQRIEDLKIISARTNLEEALLFFSPLFLAVALALRITKVTGEIRLDQAALSERSITQQEKDMGSLKAKVYLVDGGLMEIPLRDDFLIELKRMQDAGLQGKALVHALFTDDWGSPPNTVVILGTTADGSSVDIAIPYD